MPTDYLKAYPFLGLSTITTIHYASHAATPDTKGSCPPKVSTTERKKLKSVDDSSESADHDSCLRQSNRRLTAIHHVAPRDDGRRRQDFFSSQPTPVDAITDFQFKSLTLTLTTLSETTKTTTDSRFSFINCF
uniref:Uncharacterized protein n=1 Tax=Panagrellus redivivus TaxID=6233 RepID=A0A7E4VGK6_PANRE